MCWLFFDCTRVRLKCVWIESYFMFGFHAIARKPFSCLLLATVNVYILLWSQWSDANILRKYYWYPVCQRHFRPTLTKCQRPIIMFLFSLAVHRIWRTRCAKLGRKNKNSIALNIKKKNLVNLNAYSYSY